MLLFFQAIFASAAVLIVFSRPRWIVPALIISSVLDAAAVVNVGSIGIQPYYFLLILVALRAAFFRVKRGQFLGDTPFLHRALSLAIAFELFCVLGSAILPLLVGGFQVLSPRLVSDAAGPLQHSASNLAQCVYLTLNLVMLWFVAQTVRDETSVRNVKRGFIAAGTVVVGFALYQFIAATADLPFPSDLLYSNGAYVMQSGTFVSDLPRLCSTFTEPAGMAIFLVSFTAFLLYLPIGAGVRGAAHLSLVALSILVLMLATSGTAYLGLGIVATWWSISRILVPFVRGTGSGRAVALTIAATALVALAFASSSTIRNVVNQSVFNKSDSSSFDERAYADAFSVNLGFKTLGLGVGLGSNRASSFLPSMFSTIGVGGVLLFASLMGVFVLPLRTPKEVEPWRAAIMALLVSKLISSPDLSTPCLWALVASTLVIRAASERASRVQAPAPVHEPAFIASIAAAAI